jgi:hypothetical protein
MFWHFHLKMAAPNPQGGPPPRFPPTIDLTRKPKLKQGTLGFSTISKETYLQQSSDAAKVSAEKAAADCQAKSAEPQPVKRGPGAKAAPRGLARSTLSIW